MTNIERQNLRLLEAILFAASEPLNESQLASRLPDKINLKDLLTGLKVYYEGRGVELVQRGKSWAFRTADDIRPLLEREIELPRKLSKAAMEILAIIAYHQPITRAEIEEIRGVSISKGTLDVLLQADWVKPGRRRESPGRPATWRTTDNFLDHFGLESVQDLPGVNDLKAAGLLESGPAISSYSAFGDLVEMRESNPEPLTEELESSLFTELVGDKAGVDHEPLDPNG